MATINLRGPVYLTIKNLVSRPLSLFGSTIPSGATALTPVTLEDPQEGSWDRLISALRAGTANVGFPGVGGLAELIVKAALQEAISGVGVLLIATADDSVSNSEDEEEFDPIYSADRSLWEQLPSLRLRVGGIVSTESGTEPSLCLRIRLGPNLLLSSGYFLLAPTDPDNPAIVDAPWWFEAMITCRSFGVAGTLMINGDVFAAVGSLSTGLANNAVATIDLMSRQNLRVTAQFDTASVDNVVTLQTLTLERLSRPLVI